MKKIALTFLTLLLTASLLNSCMHSRGTPGSIETGNETTSEPAELQFKVMSPLINVKEWELDARYFHEAAGALSDEALIHLNEQYERYWTEKEKELYSFAIEQLDGEKYEKVFPPFQEAVSAREKSLNQLVSVSEKIMTALDEERAPLRLSLTRLEIARLNTLLLYSVCDKLLLFMGSTPPLAAATDDTAVPPPLSPDTFFVNRENSLDPLLCERIETAKSRYDCSVWVSNFRDRWQESEKGYLSDISAELEDASLSEEFLAAWAALVLSERDLSEAYFKLTEVVFMGGTITSAQAPWLYLEGVRERTFLIYSLAVRFGAEVEAPYTFLFLTIPL